MRRFARRVWRTIVLVARDPRLPRPLRAALVVGLLPIPGPFDELLLVLCAPFLLARRRLVREAWERAGKGVTQ